MWRLWPAVLSRRSAEKRGEPGLLRDCLLLPGSRPGQEFVGLGVCGPGVSIGVSGLSLTPEWLKGREFGRWAARRGAGRAVVRGRPRSGAADGAAEGRGLGRWRCAWSGQSRKDLSSGGVARAGTCRPLADTRGPGLGEIGACWLLSSPRMNSPAEGA